MKKILSLLIAVVMFSMLLPSVAFAQASCDINGVSYSSINVGQLSVSNLNSASVAEVGCVFDDNEDNDTDNLMELIVIPRLMYAVAFWVKQIGADGADFLPDLFTRQQTDVYHKVLLIEYRFSRNAILVLTQDEVTDGAINPTISSGFSLKEVGTNNNISNNDDILIADIQNNTNGSVIGRLILDKHNDEPDITVNALADLSVVVIHAANSSGGNMVKAMIIEKGPNGVEYCGHNGATINGSALSCPIATEIASLAQITAGYTLGDGSSIREAATAGYAVVIGTNSGASSYTEPPPVPEFSDYMLILTFLIAGYAMYRRLPELQKIVGKK